MNPKEYKLIAVVGVSEDMSKYGNRIFRDLYNTGYPVKGVNPKGGFVYGQNLYKSLSEIEKRPELVIAVVPPAATLKVVEECNKLGVKTLWLQPGSESSTVLEKAKAYGIKTVSSCFMAVKGIW
jgi:hypothetical protein